MKPTYRPLSHHPALLLLAAIGLAIGLACGGPSVEGREEPSFFSSGDPLDDLFGGPSLDQPPAADPEQDKPVEAQTIKDQPPKDQPAQRASFFEIPAGWTVERHSPETQMYKLIHPDIAGASIVLSTQAIDGDGDLQVKLQSIHNELVSKLPSTFKRVELREWLDGDDAHILTRLRGNRSDGSEVAVTGHSLARARRAYLILGASSPTHSDALQQAIDKILPTVQRPASQPTAALTPSDL
jgi:hypothetical protein